MRVALKTALVPLLLIAATAPGQSDDPARRHPQIIVGSGTLRPTEDLHLPGPIEVQPMPAESIIPADQMAPPPMMDVYRDALPRLAEYRKASEEQARILARHREGGLSSSVFLALGVVLLTLMGLGAAVVINLGRR